MRRISFMPALALIVLLTAVHSGWSIQNARADGFSSKDIDGGYGFSFRGFITEDPPGPVPVNAVGQFTADDGVVDDGTRTLNLGGVALVDNTFLGSAEVNPQGRGVAAFCGDNKVRPPQPSSLFPSKTLEIFEFTLTGKKSDEIEFIGTGIFALPEEFDLDDCPSPGEPPPLGSIPQSAVVIGIARQQHGGNNDDM